MIIKNAVTCLSRTILYLIYFGNMQLHLGKPDSKMDFYLTSILPVYINETKHVSAIYLLHMLLNISISKHNFGLDCILHSLEAQRYKNTHTHAQMHAHMHIRTHRYTLGSFVLASSQKNSCVCEDMHPVSMPLRQANRNRNGQWKLNNTNNFLEVVFPCNQQRTPHDFLRGHGRPEE